MSIRKFVSRRGIPFLAAAFLLACAPIASAADPARTTLNFDTDWRFSLGDKDNGSSPACDDSAWRKLNVPHDWSIEGAFDQAAPTTGAGANLPSGIAWYRKTFTLPPEAKGKKIFIEFDGIMANSEVYINNALVGKRPNGYVGLRYDLTDYLSLTGPNILAVRTDTSRQPASRWYTGAGIYRHTRLVIQNPVHIVPGSTCITTPKVTDDQATISIATTIINESDKSASANFTFGLAVRPSTNGYTVSPGMLAIRDPRTDISILPHASQVFEKTFNVDKPQLWNTDSPKLYQTTVNAVSGDNVIDEEPISFGIRTAEFKADTGFWLNGKNIKLKGVALHHDGGAFGAAVPISIWETRLAALKNIGVNAIRCCHAPMAPEFYDVCDRLGLLVMDEAFDAWTVGKTPGDYHLYFKDWWQRDLESIITAHRNHPSIVIYSLGNEIWDILPLNPDPAPDANMGQPRPISLATSIFTPMRDLAHKLDPTRPVTLAVLRPNVSGIYDNGFAELMDVVGQNYRDNELAAAHVQNPARKIIGTENYHEASTWLALRDNPALSGQFLWTGADYLGEAKWPAIASTSGLIDRTNLPKNDAIERESWWSDKPVVYVARAALASGQPAPIAAATAPATATAPAATKPNVNAPPVRPPAVLSFHEWTPADQQPHPETVNVYSNADEVELFFNDRSLGSKPIHADASPRQWQVAYQPGALKAVAKNKGQVVGTDEIRTASAPTKIVLKAEAASLPNDWDDVVTVRAFVQDASGTLNPLAANKITFAVTGPAAIAAVDNGDPQSHELFQTNQRTAFRGTCAAYLRATANSGEITVTAAADGLTPGVVKIQAAAPRGR